MFKLLQILSTVDTSQCHKQNPVIGGEEEAGWSHRAARVRIFKWCLYAEIWPEYYSKTNSVDLNNFLQFGQIFLRKYFQMIKVLHQNVRPSGGCRVSGRSGAAVVVIVTRVSVASAVSPCPLLRPATRQLRSDPSHHPPPPRLHHVFLYSYPNIRLCPHTR